MVRVTGRAAYLQIADELRAKITSGELGPGTSLPPQSQLMADYEVSNTVVKAALAMLKSEGLLIGQPGKGVFVRDTTVAPSAAGSADFAAVMARLEGLSASIQELAARVAALERVEPGRGVRSSPRARRSAQTAR